MNPFVDWVRSQHCLPSPRFTGTQPPKKRAGHPKKCRIDVVLRDPDKNDRLFLKLLREKDGEDRFIPASDEDTSLDYGIARRRSWKIPHDTLGRFLYIRSELKEVDLERLMAGDQAFGHFWNDLLTFIVFGTLDQGDPKKFNGNLNERIIKGSWETLEKFPERWKKIDSYLRHLLRDTKINSGERQRVEFLLDLPQIPFVLARGFANFPLIPHLKESLVEITTVLLIPGKKISALIERPAIQSAVAQVSRFTPASPQRTESFFETLNQGIAELGDLSSLKKNPLLRERFQRFRLWLKRAVREKWDDLMTEPDPVKACKKGLLARYSHNSAQLEILQVLMEHLEVSQDNSRTGFYFKLDLLGLEHGIQKTILNPGVNPLMRREMVRFVADVLLGQFFAPGKKIEIFSGGAFRSRENFYSLVQIGTDRFVWARLINWTRGQIKQMDLEAQNPHVLWNKTAFGTDAALLGLGILGSAVAWGDYRWRTASMTAGGTGLGALVGNLICYAGDLSNRYGFCDMIGGLVGGVTAGTLVGVLTREEIPQPTLQQSQFPPPPELTEPPLPNRGQKNPRDPYGP